MHSPAAWSPPDRVEKRRQQLNRDWDCSHEQCQHTSHASSEHQRMWMAQKIAASHLQRGWEVCVGSQPENGFEWSSICSKCPQPPTHWECVTFFRRVELMGWTNFCWIKIWKRWGESQHKFVWTSCLGKWELLPCVTQQLARRKGNASVWAQANELVSVCETSSNFWKSEQQVSIVNQWISSSMPHSPWQCGGTVEIKFDILDHWHLNPSETIWMHWMPGTAVRHHVMQTAHPLQWQDPMRRFNAAGSVKNWLCVDSQPFCDLVTLLNLNQNASICWWLRKVLTTQTNFSTSMFH